MFDKVLIANRGEIACRIMRTARRMGIRTVAVYSPADATALHVREADEAYPIGLSPAAESYLRSDMILEVAHHAGAQAIHPGYGFLSENAAFAEAVTQAGLVFVGPTAQSMRQMGRKAEARHLAQEAEIPVVPGYHDANMDLKVFATAARKIGYPVLVKASAGGGGRGMRVVTRELDLAESVKAARREAQASFGDDHVLLEKYVVRPRHIEVQVFGDCHGNVVHLWERDCSIQRRHQKIFEEAPGPSVSAELRAQLGEAAISIARASNYIGAGTVEFLVDQESNFYFLEMNTRLQVEHPVTELITSLDLVEWQFRVANGETLPLTQDQIVVRGHAIEARLYAEDPRRDDLPSTGTLVHFRLPQDEDGVRVDTGFEIGDTVSPYYDPMLAKIIAFAENRAGALSGMQRALDACQVVGVATNRDLLAAIADHSAFVTGDLATDFVAANRETLVPPQRSAPPESVALAALFILLERQRAATQAAAQSGDPTSPWGQADGWRLNQTGGDEIKLVADGETRAIGYRACGAGFIFTIGDGNVPASGELIEGGDLRADLGGVRFRATVTQHDNLVTVIEHGQSQAFQMVDPLDGATIDDEQGGHLTAPMPGRISQVFIEDGAEVAMGAPLLVLEAMKMEHTIAAPADGSVEKVCFNAGDWVDEGATLIDFLPQA